MESKKTESAKKKGWDEKNQVLTDNFGNVYDFKNKTVNGVRCNLERDTYEFKPSEFGFICSPIDNQLTINVNGYTSTTNDGYCLIYVNKKFQLKNINYQYQDNDDGTKLVKNNQTKLDGKDIELRLDYDNDRCKEMDISSSRVMHNKMTNCRVVVNDNIYSEQWFRDCLVSCDHTIGTSNKTIAKIYLMDPNNNQNYANQPVATLEFGDGIFYCVGKRGDKVYLYHRPHNDNSGSIYIYNTRTRNIESRYKIDDIDKYIDGDALFEIAQQIKKHPGKNFHELLQKFYTLEVKKFFKENPKRKVLHDSHEYERSKTPQRNGNKAAIVNALNGEGTNKADKKKSENLNKINNSSPQNANNHRKPQTPKPHC